MSVIWYGPFARLADWYHGLRDGQAGIPARPPRVRATAMSATTGTTSASDAPAVATTTPVQVTTAHREFLVRIAQDAFEHERLSHEARRVGAGKRLASAQVHYQRTQDRVGRAAADLARVSAPLTESGATQRRVAEADRPESIVRARRQKERRRRIRPYERRLRRAEADRDAAHQAHAAANNEARRLVAVAYARVRRIHEHIQRRIAAYRRRLARSHPDGPWANSVLGVLDPHIPGWAMTGLELDANGDPVWPDKPAPDKPDPAPPPTYRFPLKDITVFGAGSERLRVDVLTDFYYAAPKHFELRRRGDTFTLVDFGHGHGPFIDGKELKRATLRPGDHFDFGGYRYRISADGQFVERFSFGECDLVVADVSAFSKSITRLTAMSVVQRENTVMAILGPSGAGKTSLFYALMQELKIEKGGELYFRTFSLRTHGDQIRTMLGFVPQQDDLHRTLTVRSLLRYSDQLRRPGRRHDRERRIVAVCKRLRVDNRLDRLVNTLSGGQLKRVSIALELLAEPDLLMLDEPTSGLDAGMDREVMERLREYADQGKLVIVITHTTEHLREARQLLVLASEGRAVYAGPPKLMLPALGMDTYADLMSSLTDDSRKADVDSFARAYADGPMVDEARQEAKKLAAGAQGSGVRPTRRWWGPIRRFPRQLPVLVRRQIALMAARGSKKNRTDRGLLEHVTTPLVAGLPFLVAAGGALIAAAVAKGDGLGPGPSAPGTLSLLITLCMLAGQALTYNDIVAEFPIIKREHRTGAVTLAVVVAKWLVFAGAAVVQAGLIAVIFISLKPGPLYGNVLRPKFELFVNLSAMTTAAMTLGILISAMASRMEQAVNWNTFVAIGQIALNGVAADLSSGGFVSAAASILPTRWGLAATASSINLPGVAPTAPPDALWRHTTGQWVTDLSWLGVLTALFFVLTVIRLSRRLNKPE